MIEKNDTPTQFDTEQYYKVYGDDPAGLRKQARIVYTARQGDSLALANTEIIDTNAFITQTRSAEMKTFRGDLGAVNNLIAALDDIVQFVDVNGIPV